VAVWGLFLGLFCVPARGEPLDLEGFSDQLDVIGCARAADEAGDAAIADALRKPKSRVSQLVAVRAAPFVHAPELLAPTLIDLACGRDPVIAVEAALSLEAMFERLTPTELASREVLKADLSAAKERAEGGCALEPRADIHLVLQVFEQRLAALE
jgi:hypothetical protein